MQGTVTECEGEWGKGKEMKETHSTALEAFQPNSNITLSITVLLL